MTTFIITTEDEKAILLRNLLKDSPFITSIQEENHTIQLPVADDFSINKIKRLLADAKGKGLFKDVPDASEWQRAMRKNLD